MSDTITRCPKCATSFRISEAHLKSAKGAVRCGSCLNIFNARENLVFRDEEPEIQEQEPVETPAEKVTATKTPSISATRPAPSQTVSPRKAPAPPKTAPGTEDEDRLISDDMEDGDDEELVQDEKEDEDSFLEEFNSSIFSDGAVISGPDYNLFERNALEEDGDEEEADPDESWAESLLKDDDDEEPLRREPPKPDTDDEEASMAEFSGSYSSRSPFRIIDEEPEEEFSPNKPLYAHPDPAFDSIDIDEIGEEAYKGSSFESNRRYIHSIEPEPVEFAFKRSYPLWYSAKFWAALSLLAGVALLAQLAARNFDTLSRIEPYRGYYAKVCPWVGCELPPLIDRSRIRATNLVVRSHPNLKSALMVDAVLQNNAGFPQTFPSLDLVFTDLQGKPLAARRFTPEQYLGGEVAGRKDMPIKQPIHISLEIVDPGPQAVSYFITIAD